MGYDLTLYKKTEGVTAAELIERDEETLPAFTPEECKAAAAAVHEALPDLDLFQDEAEGVYEFTDDETGLQIEFYERSMAIAVPYWHEGGSAANVFAAINKVLSTINNVVPIVVFDPQLGKDVDPATGLTAAETAYYSKTTTHVQEILNNPSPKGSAYASFESALAKKPWWKFW